MKRLLIAVILVLTVFAIVIPQSRPTSAADSQPKCNAADVVKAASALKSSGNDKTDMTALLKLADQIQAANIACNGYTFKGTGNKLIGPVILPDGTWNMTLKTSGYFIGQLKTLTGTCEAGGLMGDNVYTIMQGQATDGASVIVTTEGCKLAIQTSNVSSSWTLTFESLDNPTGDQPTPDAGQ